MLVYILYISSQTIDMRRDDAANLREAFFETSTDTGDTLYSDKNQQQQTALEIHPENDDYKDC